MARLSERMVISARSLRESVACVTGYMVVLAATNYIVLSSNGTSSKKWNSCEKHGKLLFHGPRREQQRPTNDCPNRWLENCDGRYSKTVKILVESVETVERTVDEVQVGVWCLKHFVSFRSCFRSEFPRRDPGLWWVVSRGAVPVVGILPVTQNSDWQLTSTINLSVANGTR